MKNLIKQRIMIVRSSVTKMVCSLVMCLSLLGCIKDDYRDCPTTGSLDLRVTYYNSTKVNTFANEISRVDFFVFDENGLFVTRETDLTGPFTDEYRKRLILPFGDYQVVVWGNLYSDTELDGTLTEGVTKMEELKIKLVTKETRGSSQPVGKYPKLENFANAIPTTQFYGITDYCTIYTGKQVEQSVDLLKNTSDVHVILRWKNYEGAYDYSTEHQRTTRAYVVGSNGDVDFNNLLTRERNVTYIPFYRDPSDEDPWQGQTAGSYIPPQIVNKDHVSVLPDFRVMRLTADGSTEKLVVTTILPDGTENIVYNRSIVDLIRLTGEYNTQADMDQTNDYLIVVDFRCVDENHQHGSSWIATTIWVNGWIIKEIDTEI